MRTETKLAALIAGLVVIGVGLWYVGSKPKQGKPDAAGPPVADMTGTSDATSPAVTDEPGNAGASSGTSAGTGADRTDHRLTGVGSPPAFNVDRTDRASQRPGIGVGPRVTEPGPSLPRMGLSDETARRDRPESTLPGTHETETETATSDLPAWSEVHPDQPDAGNRTPEAAVTPTGPGITVRAGHRDESETEVVAVGSPWTSSRSGRDAPLTSTRPAATPEPTLATGPMKTHVIEPGDTLSSLAARYLGNAKYAKRIAEANPDLDPRRLRLGVKVNIPAATAPSASTSTGRPITGAAVPAPTRTTPAIAPPPADRSYTVQPGDGWYTLAKRFLGNGNNWPELYELNKERVSGNSRALRVGTVIELPPGVTASNR